MTDAEAFLHDGPGDGPVLVLAHGAGAPMDSPFMAEIAAGIGRKGVRVVRFEFPYMAARRSSGRRRPPDRAERLHAAWRAVIAALGDPSRQVIGGKSMGGRMAAELADELGVRGLVCLGYPFHPSGRPGRLRLDALRTIDTPTLIVQGERDPLGNRQEVAGHPLDPRIEWLWLADGNHSFEPRKRSGWTASGHRDAAAEAVSAFVHRCAAHGR